MRTIKGSNISINTFIAVVNPPINSVIPNGIDAALKET